MITDKQLLRVHRKAERLREETRQADLVRNEMLRMAVAEGRRPADLSRLLNLSTGRLAQIAPVSRSRFTTEET